MNEFILMIFFTTCVFRWQEMWWLTSWGSPPNKMEPFIVEPVASAFQRIFEQSAWKCSIDIIKTWPLLSSQGRKWEAVREFAPRRSPESLKACRGLTRLLHPLPRDSSSSPAAADSSLTRANPLGSSNETPNISSRIYLSLPLQLCSCKITKSDDRIWSGNSLTLRLYEPLQGPLW